MEFHHQSLSARANGVCLGGAADASAAHATPVSPGAPTGATLGAQPSWLQDLQRALRRDDDTFRPISLLLGQWNVVVQKLLPLVHSSCRFDTPMLLTIVKILVILTKPLSENTVRAGKMVIDVKSKKSTDAYV